MISDVGLSLLSTGMSVAMTSVDISFCAEITDFGIANLVETCPNIKYLNLCGLSRLTDRGVKNVCNNLWYLTHLNLEDVFLASDDAFWYSVSGGKVAGNDLMLKSLVSLNISDCVNISERGIRGLCERCRSLETLTMRGCDKLTEKALLHMADASTNTASTELDLSGLASVVRDPFLKSVARAAKTLQRLKLAKCVFLTDKGICFLVEYLWIELLDISG
eukprot:gene23976-25597_t